MNASPRGLPAAEGANVKQEKGWPGRPPPLVVQLPNLPSVSGPWRGARYVVQSLLGSGESNPKLRKSNRSGAGYQTWGLALSPAKESGIQVCASSTTACRKVCLYRQGHARIDPTIAACRIAKTIAWKQHREWFVDQLLFELERIGRRASANRFRVGVRLNLTSDVMWECDLPAVFERFPAFQFYDYTKHRKRMMRSLSGDFPANYHLTFSRSESNEGEARDVLLAGGNVAVVFRSRPFPSRHLGFPVVDGDATDLRFLDPAGVVVALSAKGTAKGDDSGFVVNADASFRWPIL